MVKELKKKKRKRRKEGRKRGRKEDRPCLGKGSLESVISVVSGMAGGLVERHSNKENRFS